MALELVTQRRLTTAFINTQPVALVLTPQERVVQPGGGVRLVAQPPREPQVMRFVEPPYPGLPVRTADGTERTADFLLIADHDAQIGVHDTFEHDGYQWGVIFLYHFNGWERRAEVYRRG